MSKTYKVVGDAIVHGFKKGETFVADLAKHEERILVDGGHVTVAKEKTEATAPVTGGTAAAA